MKVKNRTKTILQTTETNIIDFIPPTIWQSSKTLENFFPKVKTIGD